MSAPAPKPTRDELAARLVPIIYRASAALPPKLFRELMADIELGILAGRLDAWGVVAAWEAAAEKAEVKP